MQDPSFHDCYRIIVQDIEIDCFLGVYDREQARKRPIVIDVELYVPVPADPAAHRDELATTVNYERVVEAIERIIGDRRFKLVETICNELADDLMRLPGLRALKVAVTKPQPLPRARAVRVELWRHP
ncbi:MAG: dihydroneopterin aldolase [Burkholderiales bacterium]|nr:dihydroneopterin aldolase [Burkholderiales bacterium]ODU62974.1 MAG: dihydroneopterin aldolase [Lautropia sp. SCN 66-9]